jgi:hypothetical protein
MGRTVTALILCNIAHTRHLSTGFTALARLALVLDNLQVLATTAKRRVPGRLNRNYQVTMPTVPRHGIRRIVA